MKIAVAGTGYVGLSMAVLLSQHNTVKAVGIVLEKNDDMRRELKKYDVEVIKPEIVR